MTAIPSSKMWESLGFKASPYDSRPLKPLPEDCELLVGRENEAIEFCTTLESSPEGVYVLSGPPGVGKTSFFNVQQYLLASQTADFGPKLLITEELCTIHPGDDARTVAMRVAETLLKSIEAECANTGKSLPPETQKLARWLRQSGATGIDVGITIGVIGGSFGRSVSLPNVADASFEALRDAITCMISEVVATLTFSGAFIALDNIENLEDDQLARLLITFRDTLFMVPRVWWILIGQSGLASLIQTLDPRVFDRLAGNGLEIAPLSFVELEEAIARRVARFSASSSGKSPLPKDVHQRLYDASFGETRFVFKYSSDICTAFITEIRQAIVASAPSDIHREKAEAIATKVAAQLVNSQIPTANATKLLTAIVTRDFDGLRLKPKEKRILRLIADQDEVRAKDYEKFPVTSMQDFSSNYLSRFYNQHLLARRQEGRAVYYSLRGIARIAAELGLLD